MPVMFDIIFAGGGTTACVVAGRLAADDPSLKILVVESGQHSRDLPPHVQPSRYPEHLASNSTTVSVHATRPSPHLNGRSAMVQCGRSLGGGSTVNFMMYVRGAASDYNDWYAMGNKGWSFDDVLPLIKKLETFIPISNQSTHGYAGPVKVSVGGTDLGIGRQFLDVAKEYDPARPHVDDNNDFTIANAYSGAFKYIDPVTGERCDTASRYLYPHSDNPNVTIIVGKCVKRIIIENGRAVGIEYTADVQSHSHELVTATASKFVVVSAGAFGSPAILERSGIGARSVLEKHNVPVLVDLPGVGENYQDHLGIIPVFNAVDETETMDDVWSDPQALAEHCREWERNGTGKIAHKLGLHFGIDAIVKVRLTKDQLASAVPTLRSRWESFFQNSPDKPLAIIVPCSGFPLRSGDSILVGRKLFCMLCYILYPDAIGGVHITSGDNPHMPVDFDPDYLSKPCDVAQLTLLYKMSRELARRMPAYRGEVAAYHPSFPVGSPATCTETDGPVAIHAPDIVYSEADDEAIAKFIRESVISTWHSLGTCSMKPREQGGVVDARLSVYGVRGLKVADLSICPTNVGNNTYSTALLIGEKAATIVAEELGIALESSA